MSAPTLEQYREASNVTWRREHSGITYSASHHGISSYSPKGTWCFYIHLLEEQFQRPEDFALFDREPELTDSFGSFRERYDYDSVPDHGFHGGVTFYERNFYPDKKTGEPRKALKIGCDYAHLWDQEEGFWQGLEDVADEAKALIDKLVSAYPMMERCGYSGKYDTPDQFYTAGNGTRVHVSQAEKFSEDHWPMWLPAEPAEAAQ